MLAGEVGGRVPGPVPADSGSTSGRSPAYAPTTSERSSGYLEHLVDRVEQLLYLGVAGTGIVSGTGPSTGSSVMPR